MRAVIQRVNAASVTVNKEQVAGINKGLVIFLGVVKGDTSTDAKNLARRMVELRIFADQNRKMNLNVKEANAQLLVVSEVTLCADVAGGRRPSFDQAALPLTAEKLYLELIRYLEYSQLNVEQGIFREYMSVHIDNDGPVTFILDSKKEQ